MAAACDRCVRAVHGMLCSGCGAHWVGERSRVGFDAQQVVWRVVRCDEVELGHCCMEYTSVVVVHDGHCMCAVVAAVQMVVCTAAGTRLADRGS